MPGKAWLQDNSYLYGVVALGGEQLLLRLGVWKRDRMYGLTAELFETMKEPRQETEAWRRVEKGLQQIIDMIRQSGAQVVLAVFRSRYSWIMIRGDHRWGTPNADRSPTASGAVEAICQRDRDHLCRFALTYQQPENNKTLPVC